MTKWLFRAGGVVVVLAGVALLAAPRVRPALAQHDHTHGGAAPTAKPAEGSTRGVRISMEELHRAGGVPPGWRFAWPDGDAKKGREVFAKLECYQCHEVKGESFPPVSPDPLRRGPALSGMGGHHPAEYFAEAIVSPNAVIVTGPGHIGPDGLSIMPDYRDSLTLAETIDLVAYIRSLGDVGEHAHHDSAMPGGERVAGDYRVRVAYAGAGAGHEPHQHGGTPASAAAHLMVFVNDAALGESVPYLPITVTIHADGAAPRVVRLTPMLDAQGFHYGADVTLPSATRKIVVAIGRSTLKRMPAASGRFARPTEVSFDWRK